MKDMQDAIDNPNYDSADNESSNEFDSFLKILQDAGEDTKAFDKDASPAYEAPDKGRHEEELNEDEDFEEVPKEDEFEEFKKALGEEDEENEDTDGDSGEEGHEEDEDLPPTVDVIGDLDDDAVIRIGEEEMPVSALRELTADKELVKNEAEVVKTQLDKLKMSIDTADEVIMSNAFSLSNKWNGFDKDEAVNLYHQYKALGTPQGNQAAEGLSQRIFEYERDAKKLSQDSKAIEAMKQMRIETEDQARKLKLKATERAVPSKWRQEFGTSFKASEVYPELIKFAANTFNISVPEAANLLSEEGAIALQTLKQVKEGKNLKQRSNSATRGVKKSVSSKPSIKESPKQPSGSKYRNESEEFEFFKTFL